jgi:hypothetical protein
MFFFAFLHPLYPPRFRLPIPVSRFTLLLNARMVFPATTYLPDSPAVPDTILKPLLTRMCYGLFLAN